MTLASFATHTAAARTKVPKSLVVLYVTILVVDLARKVLGAPTSALLLGDIATVLIYAQCIQHLRRGRSRFPAVAFVLFIALVVWVLLEGSTSRSTLGTLLLGVRGYAMYVPLALVGAGLFTNREASRRAAYGLTIGGVFIAAGAIASALLGSSAPLALEPIVPEVALRSFEDREIYLAPSVFATGEKAADQLMFSLLAGVALFLSERRWRRIWVAVGLAVMTAGMVATARRTPLVLAAAAGLTLLVLRDSTNGRRARSPIRRLPAITAGAGALVASALLIGGAGFATFVSSPSNALNVLDNIVQPPSNPLNVEGQGAGTSSTGLDQLRAETATLERAEGLMARVWLELGLVGLLIYGSMLLTGVIGALRMTRGGDVWQCAAGLAAVSIFLLALKGHQALGNGQVQPLFWLCVGAAWAPHSERHARELHRRRTI